MKVAVISTQSSAGKTSIMITLGAVLAKLKRRHVYYMSTGTLVNFFRPYPESDIVRWGRPAELSNAINSNDIGLAEALTVSLTQYGDYPICSFDDSTPTDRKADIYGGLPKLIGNMDLALLEVANDTPYDLAKAMIDKSNLVLIIAEQSMNTVQDIKDVIAKYDLKDNYRVIINKYDANISSLKSIESMMKLPKGSKLISIPYNPTLAKYMDQRMYHNAIPKIVKAEAGFTGIRAGIYEILKTIYSGVKYIPEVSEWA